MMKNMRLLAMALGIVVLMASYGSTVSAQAAEPVAGTKVVAVGISVTQLTDLVKGWSVKKKILGHDVYNDQNEKLGTIDDLILGSDKASSFAIVGAGGFLGIAQHDVAIPVKQFQEKDGKFILPGATKEAVKGMPEFKYAN
jgi:hypothetical protein